MTWIKQCARCSTDFETTASGFVVCANCVDEPPTVRCFYCNDPVDPSMRNTWRRVFGWERKALSATRRGGSDIAGRQPCDEYACDVCIGHLAKGRSPMQVGFELQYEEAGTRPSPERTDESAQAKNSGAGSSHTYD